jgi:hypothetical protein
MIWFPSELNSTDANLQGEKQKSMQLHNTLKTKESLLNQTKDQLTNVLNSATVELSNLRGNLGKQTRALKFWFCNLHKWYYRKSTDQKPPVRHCSQTCLLTNRTSRIRLADIVTSFRFSKRLKSNYSVTNYYILCRCYYWRKSEYPEKHHCRKSLTNIM